ncbi:MAG: helix-turn-helix transcriptional regulator [Rubrobacter sp.]|jgi:transcriptional regulator with XRE-family HTH domain|nr:helix-turn-helix transcriptional regulator [Rubrobacter sp.]
MNLPHLRVFRQRAVMSQDQLAEKSGVARDTISKLETGKRKAYPSTIQKLAGGLSVEPQMLLGGVEYFDDVKPEPEPKEGHTEKKDRKVGF